MTKPCLLEAESTKNYCIVKMLEKDKNYILQKCEVFEKTWKTWTVDGFSDDVAKPYKLIEGTFIDKEPMEKGIYQYRAKEEGADDNSWEYSLCIKRGVGEPVGYTFGNYKAGNGADWGEIVTADDIHYTYLWGVGFRASDGTPFRDETYKSCV